MFEAEISRSKFLKYLMQISTISFFAIKTTGCGTDRPTPRLKGLSEVDYQSFRSLQEVILDGNPIEDYDLGLSLDNYLYGHPTPTENEDVVLFLAGIPSSILIAIALDFSLTPLANLDKEAMDKRLQSWKHSTLVMKRGIYSILRQFSFFLLTSDKRFQEYMGYRS
ncbi:hypothetical protein [Leptospira sp. GIMC2001]|uniref:hypothetical protein n=1 Tax=Leptospira sp. GIMC2001 TaxID=1513297 RepID=UPI0023497FED|nr:hypothetical protein [Leptospira sp. GIMC2001]WCL49414.1 hypothetical protein O4O04_19315 [Leptospira sp. GIMC2001]